jgi:hypothetical protein
LFDFSRGGVDETKRIKGLQRPHPRAYQFGKHIPADVVVIRIRPRCRRLHQETHNLDSQDPPGQAASGSLRSSHRRCRSYCRVCASIVSFPSRDASLSSTINVEHETKTTIALDLAVHPHVCASQTVGHAVRSVFTPSSSRSTAQLLFASRGVGDHEHVVQFSASRFRETEQ